MPVDDYNKLVNSLWDTRTPSNQERLDVLKGNYGAGSYGGRIMDEAAATDNKLGKGLLYVGGGILLADAATGMREFAEHLSLPVAHTLMGKGALPDDHPLILGMTGFWGTKFINDKTLGADWILALGTRFSEADCSSWEEAYTFRMPPTKLIHIDIDPAELGRNYPVAIGAMADLKQALKVLNRVARKLAPSGVKRPELVAEMAANRKSFVAGNEQAMKSDAYPMRPERILADVRAALPRDALITTDVGWNKNGVGQQFPILEPGTIFTPGGYATMGFGAPAALGAKIARPDRVVVALVGDGGFGQNPAMLATAFEEDVAVVRRGHGSLVSAVSVAKIASTTMMQNTLATTVRVVAVPTPLASGFARRP